MTTMGSVVERLENEIETLRARVAGLEGRLQVDPGGSDKIDELEQSVLHLRARIAELEAPPVVPEGWEVTSVIRAQRDGWALSCGDSVVGMWYPDTGQVRITTLAPAGALRAFSWAIEHNQRPPHAGDK